jgi:V8-like Glu-specific endopeptidase
MVIEEEDEDIYFDEVKKLGEPERLSGLRINKQPYVLYGFIQAVDRRGNIHEGTGMLISPNLVLTGAGNVCHPTEKYKNIRFFPNQDAQLKAYFEVEEYFFP